MLTTLNKRLGYLLRSTKNFSNIKTLTLLFNTLVRSPAEYACEIWYPYFKKYSQEIDKVQNNFLKFLVFKSDSSYSPRGCDNVILCQRFDI